MIAWLLLFIHSRLLITDRSVCVCVCAIQILALDICADTLVGDDMRRGISGGRRSV